MTDLLQSGAPELRAIERIRSELAQLAATTKAIKSAPLADKETREHVLRGLQLAIYQYTPENKFTGIQRGNGGQASLGREGFGLADLAWIFGPETLADMVMKRLAERGAKPGLPAEARAARLAELEETRRGLERAEEEEILKLESERFMVLRRGDADPAILLDVWGAYDQGRAG